MFHMAENGPILLWHSLEIEGGRNVNFNPGKPHNPLI